MNKATKKQMNYCRSLGYVGEDLTIEEASAFIDAHRKRKELVPVASAAEYVSKHIKFYITINGKKIECKNYLSLKARYGTTYEIAKPKTIAVMLISHGFYKTFVDENDEVLVAAYIKPEEREYLRELK